MKFIPLLLLLLFNSCESYQDKQEKRIRHSINSYLKKIKVPKETQKNYRIKIDQYTQKEYILYLRRENIANCNTAVNEKAAAILNQHAKLSAGIPLTPAESDTGDSRAILAYMKTDDSLSRIQPDNLKQYYKVLAFDLRLKDTIWKNTFWLDNNYKIVW